jgi:hypothetical protein
VEELSLKCVSSASNASHLPRCYGVTTLCLPCVSHVDRIHMRDTRQAQGSNAVATRQMAGVGGTPDGTTTQPVSRPRAEGVSLTSLEEVVAAKRQRFNALALDLLSSAADLLLEARIAVEPSMV